MLAGTGRGTFAMEVRFFLSHSVVKGERREIATCALFCTGRGSVLDLNLRFAGVDKVSPPPHPTEFPLTFCTKTDDFRQNPLHGLIPTGRFL